MRVFGVELRDFEYSKGLVFVLNWCVELRESVLNRGVLIRYTVYHIPLYACTYCTLNLSLSKSTESGLKENFLKIKVKIAWTCWTCDSPLCAKRVSESRRQFYRSFNNWCIKMHFRAHQKRASPTSSAALGIKKNSRNEIFTELS